MSCVLEPCLTTNNVARWGPSNSLLLFIQTLRVINVDNSLQIIQHGSKIELDLVRPSLFGFAFGTSNKYYLMLKVVQLGADPKL